MFKRKNKLTWVIILAASILAVTIAYLVHIMNSIIVFTYETRDEKEQIKSIILAASILASTLMYFIYIYSSLLEEKRLQESWIQEVRIKAEIETLENERKRIAGDLHDDIGPILSAIKLHVNHVDPKDEEEKKAIQKAGKLMDEVIQRFRDIAYDLLPNTLLRKGLIAAISEFIGKISEAHSLNIRFKHDDSIPLSPSGELDLYRIVQEIVHNTIKHAQANQLIITLRRQEEEIIFTAKDDGKGFDYNNLTVQRKGGLGIFNIQNRVTLLNGTLKVKSEHLKGTSYSIVVPLRSK